MATPSVDTDAEFLFGSCPVCGKPVLTYTDFGPDDAELRRCLHCETIITAQLRPATGAELEANGYAIVSAGTCGDGGGCAAGGCGQRHR